MKKIGFYITYGVTQLLYVRVKDQIIYNEPIPVEASCMTLEQGSDRTRIRAYDKKQVVAGCPEQWSVAICLWMGPGTSCDIKEILHKPAETLEEMPMQYIRRFLTKRPDMSAAKQNQLFRREVNFLYTFKVRILEIVDSDEELTVAREVIELTIEEACNVSMTTEMLVYSSQAFKMFGTEAARYPVFRHGEIQYLSSRARFNPFDVVMV